jgi:hypothetical protein
MRPIFVLTRSHYAQKEKDNHLDLIMKPSWLGGFV